MKYGYFDNERREYVITNPDTPAPWANYLGDPEYGALISNQAGGYSFVKSGANGRILRYIFDGQDRPGRYIYLRDNKNGDFWSASWQPVGKDLDSYHNICRHGMGYTVMESDYEKIHTEALYYVPKASRYEVWALKIKNDDTTTRCLTVTGYAEFTNHSNYEQDQVNLQYSQFISRTIYEEGILRQQIHGNLDALDEGKEVDHKQVEERFIGLAGAEVASYCGDKEEFLGRYHSYGNPIGVMRGNLGNVLSYNENACGALSTDVMLAAGEEKVFCFIVGAGDPEIIRELKQTYASNPKEKIENDWKVLKELWEERVSALQVHTPSAEFDTMLNTWNAYNCYMTFIWSRAASFTYCGLRNGYGYRDTVQDIQGIIHLSPEMAADKIRFMLSAQVHHGGGLPLVKFTHNPGHEDKPEDASYREATGHPAYRADDALWLFPTVYKYISETGDLKFLDEVIPFSDQDEASVYEHLKRAIMFSSEHLGPHGLPAGLYADWNDCLRLGANGESTFVALQYYYAMTIMKRFAKEKSDETYLNELTKMQDAFAVKLEELCFDSDRYTRGFTEAGEVVGAKDAKEASLWLNPQSWAVISGVATGERAEGIMKQVEDHLNTPYGAILMDPPYHAHAFDGALAVIYNQGVKENSGIFSQSQGWLILAEALLGRGDEAFQVFMENAPSAQNEQADVRKLEPYCYGQFTEGPASPHFGRSHVHWLTGTASTVMVGCVEGILGLRPDPAGLTIAPSVPAEWEEYRVDKKFRGKMLHITVKNPEKKAKGTYHLTVNGQNVSGNHLDDTILTQDCNILLVRE
ncbi:Cellobiose phosphorylase [Lachnospiraceae bacterium KHCPX20]|nr:Cellobiose phosphorylase [Lachnospiraceae bacterium KHCPX20]